MIRVKNQKVITRLSQKSLKANRVRNLVAIFAITLTTMLFMALFTIAGTLADTFQKQTFRQVGSDGHGVFKDLTLEEKELLEKDPMIKEAGGRMMLGMGSGDKFRKIHAEVSYMEPAYQKHCFCETQQGRAPQEGTKEIACDTRILNYIGTEPKIGAEVTVTYQLCDTKKTEITDTFTLSGWWEYDPAGMASMAIVPRSYVEDMVRQHPRDADDRTDITGMWNLDIMLHSSMHIEEDLQKILGKYGYQSTDPSKGHYISIGVNWAYVGAQLSANADPEMIVAVIIMLALIIFTGYLIIYNIFQISVSGDIRFYGLLKTIGTTGKQIRRMIRRQALFLSAAGIPLGLLAGSLSGMALAPVIINTMSIGKSTQVFSPWFFVVAAVFSIITVLISCAKPGRIAARVSPVEAVRYTDAAGSRKRQKSRAGGKPLRMAQANLGRNKKKTALVIVSMTLAVVLLQLTVTFANGFDMDKYLSKWVVSDFILGDASYFQPGADRTGPMPAVPAEDISRLEKTGRITESARVYGHRGDFSVYAPQNASRDLYKEWMTDDEIDEMLSWREKDADGNYAMDLNLYGLEDYALRQLKVFDGDLADVFDPNQRAIAAVYLTDDYDEPMNHTQWAKVGDTVTIHYVYEYEYIDNETGEVIPKEKIQTYQRAYSVQETKAEDIEYRVAACVTMKHAMSYRYAGAFEYALNAQTFQKDSQTDEVMTWLFNTDPKHQAAMQDYLQDYTVRTNPNLDYESKQSYVQQFEQFRSMFLLMGGALSFIVGLVSVLNYFNAVLTSIYSRRREFAMLQAIGMTGRQLKQMLICEGMIYGAAAILVSLALSFLMIPLMEYAVEGFFWFFTYRVTVLPVLVMIPVFAGLGVVLPLACYRKVAEQTVVERLRESE